MTIKNWFSQLDRNDVTWWLGLALLFLGLTLSVSAATACIVCGAAVAVESALSSYITAFLNRGE